MDYAKGRGRKALTYAISMPKAFGINLAIARIIPD
jgi:hypothetical protein